MSLDSALLTPEADDDALDMGKADVREERSEARPGDALGTVLVVVRPARAR